MSTLEKWFEIKSRKTTVAQEVRGGVATYLTMSYIVLANPAILQAAGIPFAAAAAATALAAGITCLLMGLVANFPLALASGMGLNSVVAFQLASATGSWQTAMGLVVLDGLVVLLLVWGGLREAILHALPRDLKLSIAAGIGLFIAFIGFLNAKWVVKTGAPIPIPVTHGDFRSPEVWITAVGLLATAWMLMRSSKGALIVGIIFSTAIALLAGVTKIPTSFAPPDFSTLFKADIASALNLKYVPLLLALIMVDFFDTIGTVTAISEQAGLKDSKGKIPRLRQILGIDAIGASIGGLFGASSVTSYIESASGVAEGARTGLHTVVVGLLFLLTILATPLAALVPACATAPALILVGLLMCAPLKQIEWDKYVTSVPAFLIMLTIPLTFSIAHGIGIGFIAYVTLMTLNGKTKEVHPLMYGTAAVFLAYFIWG